VVLAPPDRQDLPWGRLLDRTLHRPFVITAWSILHGKLGCNAFLHHVQRRSPAIAHPCSNLCLSPACAAARHVETLSHAFLDCVDAAPAMDWLCATWAALTLQAAPPRSAAVLLADDLRAWTTDSPADDTQLLALWTRLRVTVIGSIWAARCARGQGRLRHVSLARYAIRLAVQSLKGAIERDWLRVSQDIRFLDNGCFCTDWWRGLDPKLSLSRFRSLWAHLGVFCVVDAGDDGAVPPRAASVTLRLGEDLPIPFPP
jgi:hypothetical protein